MVKFTFTIEVPEILEEQIEKSSQLFSCTDYLYQIIDATLRQDLGTHINCIFEGRIHESITKTEECPDVCSSPGCRVAAGS
jgi:hypothetical protein